MAPSKRRGPAAKFLICFNIFTLVVGLTFLVASSWAYAQFSDDSWTSWTNRQASGLGIATGVFAIIMSGIGVIAALWQRKCCLALYVCLFIIIVSCQLATASGILYFSSTFQLNNDLPSAQLTATSDVLINNAAFSIYTQCCMGCPPYAPCNNTLVPSTIVNKTTTNCYNQFCTPVQACSSQTQQKCFVFPPSSQASSGGGPPPPPVVVPPYVFDPRICTNVLAWAIDGNGKYVVGPSSQGSCGGGDPKAFLYSLDSYVSSMAVSVAVVFYVFSVIEIVVLSFGLWLLFCASRATLHAVTGFDVDARDEEWEA